MEPNRLFRQTRWQLAIWYVGIIGTILGLCGLGVYEAIAHAHYITINRELKSVAATLHDSLEPVLKQSGELEPAATRLLPYVCKVETSCSNLNEGHPHEVEAIQNKYYMRLFDLSGRLVAVAGIQPKKFTLIQSKEKWKTFIDDRRIRYRQISLLLHTRTNEKWGYMELGRSLQDFDNYVANVKWILLLGIPIVVLLVMVFSWWLAGRAMQPIYRSYLQIQQFTSDAAHELKTPLAAIRATAQSTLMMQTFNEAKAKETLRTIVRQNKRLTHLVTDLLMLCRMERQSATISRAQIEHKPVSLKELVNDLEEEFVALALASNICLSTKILTSDSLKVIGDEEQLYRLLANIVVNAIQYTEAGGEVTLILEQNKKNALIHVRDTGIGIPETEQKQIFERFYRVDKTRSRSSGGFGLGLSIAYAIAQAHQGDIEVRSQVGLGTTFTIRLPKSI